MVGCSPIAAVQSNRNAWPIVIPARTSSEPPGASSAASHDRRRSGRLVAGGYHPGRLDHENHRAPRRARAVRDACGNGVALLVPEGDSVTILDVDQQLAIEDQKELVLVLM